MTCSLCPEHTSFIGTKTHCLSGKPIRDWSRPSQRLGGDPGRIMARGYNPPLAAFTSPADPCKIDKSSGPEPRPGVQGKIFARFSSTRRGGSADFDLFNEKRNYLSALRDSAIVHFYVEFLGDAKGGTQHIQHEAGE